MLWPPSMNLPEMNRYMRDALLRVTAASLNHVQSDNSPLIAVVKRVSLKPLGLPAFQICGLLRIVDVRLILPKTFTRGYIRMISFQILLVAKDRRLMLNLIFRNFPLMLDDYQCLMLLNSITHFI